jgi:hypothetical protein
MQASLKATLDRFALVTGHKSVDQVLAKVRPGAEILVFTASPSRNSWWLHEREL